MQTIEIPPGELLDRAVQTAIDTANASGDPVQFDFNGQTLTANPGDKAGIVSSPYWVAMRESERRYQRRESLKSTAPEIILLIGAALEGKPTSLSPFLVQQVRDFVREWKSC